MPIRAAEFRQAARSLTRTPVLSLSAIACLAIGIGATTTTATAIIRALLDPLPFRAPAELVAVHRVTPQSGPDGAWPMSAATFANLALNSRTVSQLAAITSGVALVALREESVQAPQLYVTPNLFPLLGARAHLGRLLTASDSGSGQSPVAVLSHAFWTTRMGGDPSVVNSVMQVDGRPTTIVGVAQPDLRIPHGAQIMRADIWMPLAFTPARLAAWRSNNLFVLGRRAPGATAEGVDAEMRVLFGRIETEHPELRGEGLRASALQSENVRSIRAPLLLVFGAAALVLLIACTNVASLMLARGVQRRRELAIRSAIGASPWDSARVALTEGMLLSAVGAGAGVLMAIVGVKSIGALAAARMPQLAGMTIDWRVLSLALVLSVLAALSCSLVPAWRSATVDPQEALGSSRSSGGGRAHHRLLRVLVMTEVATSLVLLIGAALLLRSFSRLTSADPGFETGNILTMRITVSPQRYAERSSVATFLEPALGAMREVPGVEGAGAISLIPYLAWGSNDNIRYEGRPGNDPTRLPLVETRQVTPSFFETTRQRLVAGRLLSGSDDDKAPPVVVVSEALALRDFAGASPVGKRFHLTDSTFATIVGVVSDIRNSGPYVPPQPEMYMNYRQFSPNATSFGVMVGVRDSDPASVAPRLRAAIQSVDPTAALARVAPMRDVITTSLGQPRFYLGLIGSFAVAALLLAAAGLYGLLSYAVAQRTREFGIRLALGSTPSQVLKLVTAQGAGVMFEGLSLGLLVAWGLSSLIESMLFGSSRLDPSAWMLGAGTMLMVGLVATVVPAYRATKVDPGRAMRAE